ncbi:TRAP transporter small permease [Nitratireductor sp. GCM10026969]|uniref:TRAP transporter small permease n=1 Tax=Nitratireductor sp. GCM10026969 TaxID=3252645 RepID=UPI003617C801
MSRVSEIEALKSETVVRRNWIEAGITVALEWAATLLIGTLTALVFANAVGRYFLAKPLPWTEEMAINLLIWIAGVGIVLAGMRQSLICCNILSERMSGRQMRVLAAFCAFLGAVVMAYLSWLTWRYIGKFGSDLSPILKIPKYVGISGLFFATAGLTATLLLSIFKR